MTSSPTALDLPMVSPLPEATQKYFDICQDKLGMVPNVLQAYAFDIDKLNAFTTLYNDVMLAGQRPVETGTRDDCRGRLLDK
jgi:hypothetical protein